MTASCPLVCLHLAHPALSPICLHNPIYLHIIIMRIEPLFHLLVVGFASPSDLICSCVFSDSTIRHFFPHSFEVSTGFPFSHFLEHVTLQGFVSSLSCTFRYHFKGHSLALFSSATCKYPFICVLCKSTSLVCTCSWHVLLLLLVSPLPNVKLHIP